MLKQSKVVENATAATRNSPVVAGPGDNKETWLYQVKVSKIPISNLLCILM